jgi:hypothetical protein
LLTEQEVCSQDALLNAHTAVQFPAFSYLTEDVGVSFTLPSPQHPEAVFMSDFGSGLTFRTLGSQFSLLNHDAVIGSGTLSSSSATHISLFNSGNGVSSFSVGSSTYTLQFNPSELAPILSYQITPSLVASELTSITLTNIEVVKADIIVCDSAVACAAAVAPLIRPVSIQFSPVTPNVQGKAPVFFKPNMQVISDGGVSLAHHQISDATSVPTTGSLGWQSMVIDVSCQAVLSGATWYLGLVPAAVNVASMALSVLDPHEEVVTNPLREIQRTVMQAAGRGLSNATDCFRFFRGHSISDVLGAAHESYDLGETDADHEFAAARRVLNVVGTFNEIEVGVV